MYVPKVHICDQRGQLHFPPLPPTPPKFYQQTLFAKHNDTDIDTDCDENATIIFGPERVI